MRKKKYAPDAIYVSPSYAAERTGVAIVRIREGCRNGTIPHKRFGRDYRVDLPAYVEQLHREAAIKA